MDVFAYVRESFSFERLTEKVDSLCSEMLAAGDAQIDVCL
jgi:hypothetical protein